MFSGSSELKEYCCRRESRVEPPSLLAFLCPSLGSDIAESHQQCCRGTIKGLAPLARSSISLDTRKKRTIRRRPIFSAVVNGNLIPNLLCIVETNYEWFVGAQFGSSLDNIDYDALVFRVHKKGSLPLQFVRRACGGLGSCLHPV
jgi:hypothetical protein